MSVKDYALSLVGQGYIYGAKGQICSRAFREGQAAQYPEYQDNILNVGAKWDGMPVWDCAQLTRAVARQEGVTLPSGATSQWNEGPWKRKGEIATIPQGEPCFVFRRQKGSSTVMAHTGVALGDGTCVHARGTAYGVVHQKLDDFAWTHWASPWDEYKEGETMAVLYTAVVTADRGTTVRVRNKPDGLVLNELKLGTEVEVLAEEGSWSRIRFNSGLNGYMMSKFLRRKGDASGDTVTVTLDRALASALLEALNAATARG